MIHRDVKPSNILITADGEPMLTDFGIAKILDLEDTADLTGTGMGIGTPEYMAPEQWTGKTSPQSDQYAMGVVLYEMLTGRKPYMADTPAAVLIKQATEPLLRPSQFTRDLPEKVEKLLLKALAKDPINRYSTMHGFAIALESLQGGVSVSLKPQPAQPVQRILDTQATIDQGDSNYTIQQEHTHAGTTTQRWTESTPPATVWKAAWLPRVIGLGMILVGLILLISELAKDGLFSVAPVLGIGSTKTSLKDGMVMVYVPAGNFTMGYNSPDAPAHNVYLENFWIDQTEVTNGMYALCVQEGDCRLPSDTSSDTRARYFGNSQFTKYPVIYVDWNDAQAYCNWAGRRLPSETEWEKAARGTDGRTYPWGNESPTCELTNSFCMGDTAQVGSYPAGASPYGALDMSGNVWQWIADWYDVYPGGNKNVESNFGQTLRVMRSNGWQDYENGSYFRGYTNPDIKQFDIGFRCALSANP